MLSEMAVEPRLRPLNSPLENTPHNARVVSIALMAAPVALFKMTTQNSGAADFDRSHHAALRDR